MKVCLSVFCLWHAHFQDRHIRRVRRETFLREIGDKEPVQKYRTVDDELRKALGKHAQFSGWKSKVPRGATKKDKIPDDLPDDLLGLLRFVRNKLVHEKETFSENNMYKDLFPEFYVCANQLARDMGWK